MFHLQLDYRINLYPLLRMRARGVRIAIADSMTTLTSYDP
jgi:hypothetical protein